MCQNVSGDGGLFDFSKNFYVSIQLQSLEVEKQKQTTIEPCSLHHTEDTWITKQQQQRQKT